MQIRLIEGKLNVTMPIHKVLQQFFEERLRGEFFGNGREITERLQEWPAFAISHGIPRLNKGFEYLLISGEYIICPGGMGGPFIVGTLTS